MSGEVTNFLPPVVVPTEATDDEFGHVVLTINGHGVAVAYGPYGEMEAHTLGDFLSPVALGVWVLDLGHVNPDMGDALASSRYLGGEYGPYPLREPLRPVDRETTPPSPPGVSS